MHAQKDIVLNRTEAFNAVALVDAAAVVWERYFGSRILHHANSHVRSHQLEYKWLLSRTPTGAAESIEAIGHQDGAAVARGHTGVFMTWQCCCAIAAM